MQIDTAAIRVFLSRDLMDLLIRIGLIAFVTILCARIFAPFTGLLLWALILAVALYPPASQPGQSPRGKAGLGGHPLSHWRTAADWCAHRHAG